MSDTQSPDAAEPSPNSWQQLYLSEDWWAVWIGTALLLISLVSVLARGDQRTLTTAQYEGLFLIADDLPNGFKQDEDSRSETAGERDKIFQKGSRAGMMAWATEGQTSAMSRIVDTRWVFPDEESAKIFVVESLETLSEGMPSAREFEKVSNDCHLFGPAKGEATEALGSDTRGYAYVFREGNIVVKLFVSQGAESDDELRPELVLPLAQSILKRVKPLSGPNYAGPLKPWLVKPASWESSPIEAFYADGKSTGLLGMVGALAVGLIGFGLGVRVMRPEQRGFAVAFLAVFALAVLAYVLAGQKTVKSYNLEYALWALAVGLAISNTVGAPEWIKPALCTEFYIKTGLVLLGAEVLLSKLLALGLPGVFVAWVVTPVVLITTFWFGQRILKIESPSLNMVISADMSVCGVSAAIATAAACKAKKEELSLAIGMSLSFTVVMMVVLPMVIRALGMSDTLGGAWLGGTIDATGAVAVAGEMLGDDALQVAATVKMIQNILIGVVAFCVAVYWVTYVERDKTADRPGAGEIWRRFPKFIIGFVAASAIFSTLYGSLEDGKQIVDATIKDGSKNLRGWFFCLAFVSIGLESNFRELAAHIKGGKPLVLYVAGQTLNLCLTLLMAWLMFEKVFPEAAGGIAP